ncbi:unnamed protein product [Moneuplotes crassus]|uniref:Uncharacterized protein n=1 Tax=Euplotes crassus TaxID=5936 RepID=A0AAD1U297_EUPCR|nr:unnamed protein product [Moneuplotes crassus]
MKARDFIEISNREEERFRKTTRPCPLPPSIIEQKVERLTPQKYQYYDGNSAVVGSPFNETGSRNNDFTSKSFVSNSIFYEHHKPGYATSDMYLTMSNLHQSRSVERQSPGKQLRREGGTPTKIESFRPKSKVNTNMTTMKNDFVGNIHDIYKVKLGKTLKHYLDDDSQLKCGRKRVKDNKETLNIFTTQSPQILPNKNKSRNHVMERCVTAPTLGNENIEIEESASKKPPKIPVKPGINHREKYTNKVSPEKTHRRSSHQEKFSDTKSHYSNRSTSKINKSKSPIKNRSRSRYSRNGSKHMVTPPRGKLHLSANKQRELNLSASRSDNYNILTGQKRNETKEVHINSEFSSPKAAGVVKEREERIKTPNYDIRKAPGMHKKILKDLKDNDCMWLNHLSREELVRKVREDRIDNMQDYILRNPQKYTENVTCQEISDSEMQKKGILNEMSGDPILQVHCLKQKKRDKLKKYLYRQNPRKGGHEYNKWLLQNSKGASLTMTPDKTFGRVIPIDKEQYHRDLVNQIQMDKVRKESEKTLGFHERQKNQLCYERKMKTLEKIINTSRADRRKRYINQVCKKSCKNLK